MLYYVMFGKAESEILHIHFWKHSLVRSMHHGGVRPSLWPVKCHFCDSDEVTFSVTFKNPICLCLILPAYRDHNKLSEAGQSLFANGK